jgi:signal transduction histidine kinase
MEGDAGLWKRLRAITGSIRWRVTVAAVAVVGAALVAGSVAMLAFLHRESDNRIRSAARLRALEIAAVLQAGETPRTLAVEDEEEVLIQILDQGGAVVASSPNMAGRPAVAQVEPGETTRIASTPIENEPSIVAAEAASGPAGTFTVLVARNASDESTGDVADLLQWGVPLVLLVVGATTWRAVDRALTPTLDKLEAAQARQRRFVGDASHELRSPLAAVRQHAEVALTHPERTGTAKLAQTVLDESTRMQRLVEDLLLLARADEGSIALRRGPVDVDDVVFDVAGALRRSSGHHVDTTGVSAGRVAGDEDQLRRVVQNLADNAARHAHGRVAFSLAEGSGRTRLCVDDDGTGVPDRERQRVFERFVRLDDARSRDEGGNGLGLAIVAEIVAAHGGTVTVGQSPLGGARFEVVLPTSA